MAYLTGGTLADRVARARPAPGRRGGAPRRRPRERAGRRAPGRRRAPRHQAGQRALRRRRRAPPRRLRRGQLARRHRRAHRDRHGRRHARLHGTRAGARRGGRPGRDVFALGATLLYAATGEGPYGKGRRRAAHGPRRAGQGATDPARRCPRRCASACRRCSTHDPSGARRPPRWSAGRPAPWCAGPVARRRRRWPVWVGRRRAGGAPRAASPASWSSTRETGDAARRPPTTTDDRRAPTCPYQPCGAGRTRHRAPTAGRCLAGFEDYDDGRRQRLRGGRRRARRRHRRSPRAPTPIEGTIVPRDDVDTFAMAVGDGSQLLCDGRFTVHDHRARGHDAAPRGARRRRGRSARPPAPTACTAR